MRKGRQCCRLALLRRSLVRVAGPLLRVKRTQVARPRGYDRRARRATENYRSCALRSALLTIEAWRGTRSDLRRRFLPAAHSFGAGIAALLLAHSAGERGSSRDSMAEIAGT